MCNFIKNPNTLISVCALIVAICSMYVAFQTWLLKKGHKVRGAYYIKSSIDSSFTYIHRIVLENLKDKDLVIYNIYIKFGRNIYVNILSPDVTDDDRLHIIPALSTRQFVFGPPYMSVENSYLVDLSTLLNKYSYRHGKIVLLTSSGRINVSRSYEFEKTPLVDYFKNYGTMDILQYRYPTQSSILSKKEQDVSTIDYSSYGDRIKFIVKLRFENGREIEYKVHKQKEYKVVFFDNLNFTDKSLENKENLRKFLEDEKKNNHIEFEEIISIIDLQEVFIKQREKLPNYPTELVPEGWVQYHIFDWIQTKWYNFIERESRRLKGK